VEWVPVGPVVISQASRSWSTTATLQARVEVSTARSFTGVCPAA